MQLIRADNISFRFDSQSDMLFEKVSLAVYEQDRIGLIGKNGSGKSTLLNILMKVIKPIGGSVYHMPELAIGYLPQELTLPDEISGSKFLWNTYPSLGKLKQKIDNIDRYPPNEISEIFTEFEAQRGYDFQIKLEKVITQFRFDDKMLERQVETLSGGERTRLALCRILLSNPNILFLDEPTNHLDIKALQWLEEFLKGLQIPYIIVSHDRYILDTCANKILELRPTGISGYSGNYSFYKMEKERELNLKIHKYKEQTRKIKKLKEAAVKRKSWALSHQPQTGPEGYAPIYENVRNLSKNAMVQARNLERRIERCLKQAEMEKPFIEKKRKIHFGNSDIRSNYVLRCKNVSKKFSGESVLSNIDIDVRVGERLAIIGRNGSGKTTLLKIITGKLREFEGEIKWSPQTKIGFYSQDFENLNFSNTVLEEVIQGDNTKQTFARTVLGCLNIPAELIDKQIKALSIGERSKVALAKLIVSESNVLVLDEPTNHLEIEAREALEDALKNFPGTVIFATHDRFLINDFADRIIDLD